MKNNIVLMPTEEVDFRKYAFKLNNELALADNMEQNVSWVADSPM
jgi:hypothetical protein